MILYVHSFLSFFCYYYFSHLSLCAILITNNRAQEKEKIESVMQDIFFSDHRSNFFCCIYIPLFHLILCVTLLFILIKAVLLLLVDCWCNNRTFTFILLLRYYYQEL